MGTPLVEAQYTFLLPARSKNQIQLNPNLVFRISV
jgi:hypothetical protein